MQPSYIIGPIARLAGLSARPSVVCPVQARNSK